VKSRDRCGGRRGSEVVSEAPAVFDLFALIVFGGESGLCLRQKKIGERVGDG
jgi:hypothetical protein